MHTRCFTFVYLNFLSLRTETKRGRRRGKHCIEIEKVVKLFNIQLILNLYKQEVRKIQEDGYGPYRLPEQQCHTLNQGAV